MAAPPLTDRKSFLLQASFLFLTVLLCVHGSSAMKAHNSIWELTHSEPDLSLVSYAIDQLPDLVLNLADPDLSITVFLPNNKAFMRLLQVNSTEQALRMLLRTSDICYPVSDISFRGADARFDLWQILYNHILITPKHHMKKSDMKEGEYATLLGYMTGGDSYVTVTKSGKTGTFLIGEGMKVGEDFDGHKIVRADLKAGKALVHILNGVLLPSKGSAASMLDTETGYHSEEHYDQISSVAGSIFYQVIDYANLYFMVDQILYPVTCFLPTDEAMTAWLDGQGKTLDDLLFDVDVCAQLVQAHCVPSDPALHISDLFGIAAAELNITDASGRQGLGTGRRNILGDFLHIKPVGDHVRDASHIFVGFASKYGPSKEPEVWGRLGPTGMKVGYGAGLERPVISVVHQVDTVLMEPVLMRRS